MNYTLRFWSEFMSPQEIAGQALPFLADYSAGVAIAVFSESLTDENARAFHAIKDAGVELTYWPLLGKDAGYFPGEKNVPEFASFVHEVVDWAERQDVTPDILAVDQEMPFDQMMSMLEPGPDSRLKIAIRMLRGNRDRERYFGAKAQLIELDAWLKAREIKTLSAILPWVALELKGVGETIQDLMETPVAGIEWDILSPMMYVSMLTGMSGGLLSELDANWLLFDTCLWLRTRYPGRAGVSLGATGHGVLGNEPVFERPAQLVAGVEAALAAGIRDVSVYNLEGIMSSEEPREWFEALRESRPRVPARSGKVTGTLAALRSIYKLLQL